VSRLGVSINGAELVLGELLVEQETIDVFTRNGSKPDLSWTHVDKAGHFHAYGHEGNLPTLDRQVLPVPCDGSCGGICGGEGSTRTVYRCLLCGKKVKPQRIDDSGVKRIPGRKTWTLVVEATVPDERFSFTAVVDGGRQYFGLAERVEWEISGTDVRSVCPAYPVSWRPIGGTR
jgi:hypothetical protein